MFARPNRDIDARKLLHRDMFLSGPHGATASTKLTMAMDLNHRKL